MFIYTNTNYDFNGKRRKRGLRAKRRTTPYISSKPSAPVASPFITVDLNKQLMDKFKDIPSLHSDVDDSHMRRKDTTKYSGDEIMGIATMHKSNAVPVSKNTDAKIYATMRRN